MASWLFLYSVYADSIEVQGEVSGTWSADSVLVIGDIRVPDSQQLAIQPGTWIIFQGPYVFTVEGSIIALGTSTDRITFTVMDTTGFSNDSLPDGGWRGIRFQNPMKWNDSSLFMNCRFNYGKAVSDQKPEGNGGAISVTGFGKIRIEHSVFENNFASFNGGAVYLDSADVVIRDCRFVNNSCGPIIEPWGYGGAVCSDNSAPWIWNSYFEANSSTGTGGGIAMRFKDGTISNNEFNENYSALGGAIAVLHIDTIIHTFCNNLIHHNVADFFGGGIANINASPTWVNTTIADNYAIYGGGFYCKDIVTPHLHNSILWGNIAYSGYGNQVYLFEPYSQANFYYCDVQYGPDDFGGSGGSGGFYGDYENNMDLLPEFAGYGSEPYRLSANSPCIDAGDPDTTGLHLPWFDLSGVPRIFNDHIDMGPYEIYSTGSGSEPGHLGEINVYPNPACDLIHIVQAENAMVVELFDMLGRMVMHSEPSAITQMIRVDSLNEGWYQLVVTMKNGHIRSVPLVIQRIK